MPLIGFDDPNPKFIAALVMVLGQTPANDLATIQGAEAEMLMKKVLK